MVAVFAILYFSGFCELSVFIGLFVRRLLWYDRPVTSGFGEPCLFIQQSKSILSKSGSLSKWMWFNSLYAWPFTDIFSSMERVSHCGTSHQETMDTNFRLLLRKYYFTFFKNNSFFYNRRFSGCVRCPMSEFRTVWMSRTGHSGQNLSIVGNRNVYSPKTFVGTMGHAEDDIAFDAGHMCSDIIEKQRCFFIIFMKIPMKITISFS